MRALLPLCAAALAACSPAQDWRELRPEDSGAVAMFPCRPTSHARRVPLAGQEVMLTLHACTAGDDVTYALAVAEIGDPARVSAALDALRNAAAGNVGAGASSPLPLAVAGATPYAGSGRIAHQGRRGDGQAVQLQVAVFAKGTRAYQATVVGAAPAAEAADTFFAGLKTP